MPKVLKQTFRKLWCLSAYKKSTSSLTYFLRYCKDIANLLFWELWECLAISINITLSICSKLSCLYACKKSTSSLNYFLRHCKEIANLLSWVIWIHIPKMIIAIWRNLWRLSVGKRSSYFFTFSLRYYTDIVTLLFWVLWAGLARQTQSDTINL